MYVCICNAITENHIAAAVEDGASDVNDLGQALGLGSGCGSCLDLADSLLQRHSAATNSRTPRSADRLGVRHYAPV